MKMIKMALLGGAALAVSTAAASADDLSALKAQIESLNARVASMEAAPAVPAGYSLMTISEGNATVVPGSSYSARELVGYGDKATIIGVLPTADAPASTTIEWSGYARAALVYNASAVGGYDDGPDGILGNADDEYGLDDDIDVYARGQLKVVGKTETAVGEVGVAIQLRGNFTGFRDTNAGVVMNEAWGWWAMTPELTLGGGFTGSLGNIGYGYDGACNCYYTDNADVAMNPGDAVQMRLSYASGPFSFGVAIEDDTRASLSDSEYDALAVAAEIKYSGDSFNGEISGYAGDNGRWRGGVGLGLGLGDMASLSMGAQMGSKGDDFFGVGVDGDFWTASILGSVNLSDEIHAEVAYGHTEYDDADSSVDAVLAGIYYDPVSQLTIGLEGEWISDAYTDFNTRGDLTDDDSVDAMQIDLVTVFRF
jgi:hypothetical protein